MRNSILLFIMLFGSTLALIAQQPPYPRQTPDPAVEIEKEWRLIRGHLRALDDVIPISERFGSTGYEPSRSLMEDMYRSSTNEELKLLEPDSEVAIRYRDFLKQSRTGLIKLVLDFGCDELSNKNRDSKICERFSMSGGGSAYSFRKDDYQFWRLADLIYTGRSFIALGQRSQGFLANIGDVPIDKVTPTTRGLDFVFSYVPLSDFDDAEKQNTQFADGFQVGSFLYKKFLPVVDDNTYILRSIAYRGDVVRDDFGKKYNELDFDDRKDVIVAFRVVKRDFNGTVTLVWKTLQTKRSPVLGTQK